jgi:hypothetical protein
MSNCQTRSFPLLGLVGAAMAALSVGCGSSAASPEVLSPNAGTSVTWVGVDQRPLAVGTQLTLSFQLPAGKTSEAEYLSLTSSNPGVLSLSSIDLAHNRMLLNAESPGQAAIQLTGHDVSGSLSVSAAQAAQIEFFDENYLAALREGSQDVSMWVPLPKTGFGLLSGGQEVIGAILKDASGQELNSRGLAIGEGQGALKVTKEEPEMFVLSRLPATPASEGTFCAGLTATCSAYPVALVDSIAQVAIVVGPASDNVSVIAVAQAQDANQTPIFGVSDWEFKLDTGGATFSRLSPAAIQVTPSGSPTVPITLTATAVNEGVSGTVPLF